MTANAETLWDAVKTQIVGLSLTGLDADSIRQQQIPQNPKDNQLETGAFLTPFTEREGGNGTNLSNDIGYGYLLWMIKRCPSTLGKSNMPLLLTWREAIRKKFHNRSPLTANGCYTCTVEHSQIVLPDAWKSQYDASALIIRCWVLEQGT